MNFGDVIKYNGKEFVFLAKTVEIIYLALIIPKELSQDLVRRRHNIFTRGSGDMIYKQAKIAWCFVQLYTKEFKGRVAYYANPGDEHFFEDSFTILGTLNFNDQNNLKKEIQEDSGISGVLRKLVKDITIIKES